MKNLLIMMMLITSASIYASAFQIKHKTCNLWIPTWKPQGQLSDFAANETKNLLQLKGYNVRFGSSRIDDSDNELFLGNREVYVRTSNWLRKGKANLTLTLQDLGKKPDSASNEVYVDSSSIKCSFYHSADPAAYKDYTKACSAKLIERALLIPNCVIH